MFRHEYQLGEKIMITMSNSPLSHINTDAILTTVFYVDGVLYFPKVLQEVLNLFETEIYKQLFAFIKKNQTPAQGDICIVNLKDIAPKYQPFGKAPAYKIIVCCFDFGQGRLETILRQLIEGVCSETIENFAIPVLRQDPQPTMDENDAAVIMLEELKRISQYYQMHFMLDLNEDIARQVFATAGILPEDPTEKK